MLAVTFTDVVIAIHVMAVVATLGVVFAYPVLLPWIRRTHPEAMPAVHEAQDLLNKRLVSPGLLVILAAGVYLATKEKVWDEVWVSVPVLILFILGGLSGALISPTARKLADVARRDLRAGGQLSNEYNALFSRVQAVAMLFAALVLIAIFFMVAKPGA